MRMSTQAHDAINFVWKSSQLVNVTHRRSNVVVIRIMHCFKWDYRQQELKITCKLIANCVLAIAKHIAVYTGHKQETDFFQGGGTKGKAHGIFCCQLLCAMILQELLTCLSTLVHSRVFHGDSIVACCLGQMQLTLGLQLAIMSIIVFVIRKHLRSSVLGSWWWGWDISF